ncbi:MAG: GyrI-like domain-containing protein [Pseudomonadales bacterium]|nr:GyrI-like domain-containing protein [Pseudomonadales bacterium]
MKSEKMNAKVQHLNYQQKMTLVYSYIEQHLDDDLSLDVLSEVACFSKFHFHRQFSEYSGISLYKYLQLLRLKRASYQLVFNPQQSVLDIALDAAFSSSESFSRAFKKAFSQTPSEFRNKPLWEPWLEKYQFNTPRGAVQMDVKIIDFPETLIAVLEHSGPVGQLNYSIEKFIDWRQQSKLSPVASSGTYGLAYTDRKTTNPADFRFDVCGEVKQAVAENAWGVVNKVIPAGRYACIRHIGSHDQLDEKVCYLYNQWLIENNQRLADFPCFFQYLNLFPEVPEHALITDIYLGLQ